jgi:hypothetical protein
LIGILLIPVFRALCLSFQKALGDKPLVLVSGDKPLTFVSGDMPLPLVPGDMPLPCDMTLAEAIAADAKEQMVAQMRVVESEQAELRRCERLVATIGEYLPSPLAEAML